MTGSWRSWRARTALAVAVVGCALVAATEGSEMQAARGWREYDANPFVIHTAQPAADDDEARGGITVAGDAREEIIVVSGNDIRVHWNDQSNPHPPRLRCWTQQHYRRSKANWNYYSP